MLTKKWTRFLPLFLLAAVLALFFVFLNSTDNKYQTPPPYGKDGVITLTDADLRLQRPIFLIDGWLLTDSRSINLPTYIGEYSNLQRGDRTVSPHGKATYQMTLRYSGKPVEAAISFPQLYSKHIISLDGKVLARGSGGARLSFALTPGDHLITVQTASSQGFYSGMYHPPVLGEAQAVSRLILIQCIVYGAACVAPLVLALFTLVLWRSSKDRTAFWFGLLCGSFSLYLSYYFVRLFSLPVGAYWYLIQSAALYTLCFCVIRLTILICDGISGRAAQFLTRAFIFAPALLLVLAVLIPVFPQAVWLHGILTDAYYLYTFCSVILLVFKSKPETNQEERFTLLACTAFGAGLLINLFQSNLFEPIMFFWQFEWCGLLFVVLFGAMMAARNKRILAENDAFRNHLEDLVEKRTEELTNLLQERKAFFADMAHDLKAPIFAAQSFIQAIRENNTGVDSELLHYIDQVEQKQHEMAIRVQGMTRLEKMDPVSEKSEPIPVQALLREIYEIHSMEAEIASIHLDINLPDEDGTLFAPHQKLLTLFENLIVNALRATPAGGRITVSAEIDESGCHFSVADTGCGIPFDDLPHIFERFYIGKKNKGSGSGLGLYIVNSIVNELHGEISVSSKPDHGTIFYIDLPLKEL